jgi:acetyl-CoA carboxylase carboxyl transferase subunit beta
MMAMSPEPDRRKPAPVECAGAVVVDERGRLLLVRRGRAPALGSWSLPGGRVDPGETPAQTAAREVAEETGLAVEVGELLATVDLTGGFRVHDFAARVVGGALAAGDDADDARWVAPDELDGLDLSPGLADELRRMGAIPG